MPAPFGVGILWLDLSLGRSIIFFDIRKGIIAFIPTTLITKLIKKLRIHKWEPILIKFYSSKNSDQLDLPKATKFGFNLFDLP